MSHKQRVAQLVASVIPLREKTALFMPMMQFPWAESAGMVGIGDHYARAMAQRDIMLRKMVEEETYRQALARLMASERRQPAQQPDPVVAYQEGATATGDPRMPYRKTGPTDDPVRAYELGSPPPE